MPASKTLLLAALFGLAVFAKPQDGSDTDADSDSDLDTDDSGDSSSSPAPTAGGADSTSALSYPSAVVTDLTTFCSETGTTTIGSQTFTVSQPTTIIVSGYSGMVTSSGTPPTDTANAPAVTPIADVTSLLAYPAAPTTTYAVGPASGWVGTPAVYTLGAFSPTPSPAGAKYTGAAVPLDIANGLAAGVAGFAAWAVI